jgi:hypothetical protein
LRPALFLSDPPDPRLVGTFPVLVGTLLAFVGTRRLLLTIVRDDFYAVRIQHRHVPLEVYAAPPDV